MRAGGGSAAGAEQESGKNKLIFTAPVVPIHPTTPLYCGGVVGESRIPPPAGLNPKGVSPRVQDRFQYAPVAQLDRASAYEAEG